LKSSATAVRWLARRLAGTLGGERSTRRILTTKPTSGRAPRRGSRGKEEQRPITVRTVGDGEMAKNELESVANQAQSADLQIATRLDEVPK
jgi:hypothetical protein